MHESNKHQIYYFHREREESKIREKYTTLPVILVLPLPPKMMMLGERCVYIHYILLFCLMLDIFHNEVKWEEKKLIESDITANWGFYLITLRKHRFFPFLNLELTHWKEYSYIPPKPYFC